MQPEQDWDRMQLVFTTEDDEGRALICSVSGAPIWADEDVLEGDGDVVIRSLVLATPPREEAA